MVDAFLEDTGITVEWDLDEIVWRTSSVMRSGAASNAIQTLDSSGLTS